MASQRALPRHFTCCRFTAKQPACLYVCLSSFPGIYLYKIYLSIHICIHGYDLCLSLNTHRYIFFFSVFINLICEFIKTFWAADCPFTMLQANHDNINSKNHPYCQWNLSPLIQRLFGRTQHSPLSTAGCRYCI